MLYKEYDEKTLHRLQQIELEILRDFDELCTENGLSYFGCGGTAIGAVRHHGMIPWDDDIDVGLLRKDYEKFLRIARQKKWRRKYKVVNAATMENYPLMTTRWCKKGTKFKEDALKNIDGDLGIFLDPQGNAGPACFPQVALPACKESFRLLQRTGDKAGQLPA